MRKTIKIIFRDIRRFLRGLSKGEGLIFLIVWILIVFRVVFPIKHMPNGYVVYLDPIQESELCVEDATGCDVDVSRTFTAVGVLGLTALGTIILKRKK